MASKKIGNQKASVELHCRIWLAFSGACFIFFISAFTCDNASTAEDSEKVKPQPALLRLPATFSPASVATEKSKVEKKEVQKEAEPEKKPIAWKRLTPELFIADGSVLYVSVNDLQRALVAGQSSSGGKFLRESGLWQTLMQNRIKFKENYLQGDGLLSPAEGRRRSDEWDLLERLLPFVGYCAGVALSVESVAPIAPVVPTAAADADLIAVKPTTIPDPKVLLILTLPQNEIDRQRELEAIFAQFSAAQSTDVAVREEVTKVGEYEIHVLENVELELHESWAFVENLFLYGRGKGVTAEAVERWRRGGVGSLSLNRDYAAAYATVGRESAVYAHLNLGAAAETVTAHVGLPGEITSMLFAEMKGVKLLAYGLGVDAESKSLRERIFSPTTVEVKERCMNRTARFVPGDAVFYFAEQRGSLAEDLKKAYESNQKLPAEHPLRKGFQELVLRYQQVLSAGKVDDAMWMNFSAFKGEMAVFGTYVPGPSGGNPFSALQMVFVVEGDPDREESARMCLTRLEEKAGGGAYKVEEYARVKIRYRESAATAKANFVEPGKAGTARMLPATFLPDWLKTETPFFNAYVKVETEGEERKTFYLFANDLEALKKALRQNDFAKTSLAQREEFVRALSVFQTAGRVQAGFISPARLVDWVYESLLPLAAAASQGFNVQLPSSSMLRENLTPVVYAVSGVPEGGALTEIISPTGTLPLLGVGVAALAPSFSDTARKAVSARVSERFKQIGLAIHLYAADFDRFPSRLSDLYPKYLKDLSVFEPPPFGRGLIKTPSDIDNPEKSGLVYVRNRDLRGFSRDVQMYEVNPTFLPERGETARPLHHVLCINNTIRGLTESNLERVLSGETELGVTEGRTGADASKTGLGRKGKTAPPKAAGVKPRPTPKASR